MEMPLKTPISLFVRVKGPRGERELKAILNTFATHMTIPFKDAFRLGYSPPFDPHEPIRGEGIIAFSTVSTLEVCTITLQEVMVGDLKSENVEAIVYELPPELGVDMLLGTSFLQNFKTTLDYGRGILKIEELGPQNINREPDIPREPQK